MITYHENVTIIFLAIIEYHMKYFKKGAFIPIDFAAIHLIKEKKQ